MSIFFSLFCDWSILLGRVDNPMRDDLDIVRSEIFRSSSKKQFGRARFEERVNIFNAAL